MKQTRSRCKTKYNPEFRVSGSHWGTQLPQPLTCWHHLARTLSLSIRCWVLTKYFKRLSFLSESDWSEDLDLSTSSFKERKDSSAARLTRVEKSTVCCPNSAILIPSLKVPKLGPLMGRLVRYQICIWKLLESRVWV